MRGLLAVLASGAVAGAVAEAAFAEDKPGGRKVTGPLDFTLKGIDGQDVDLARYRGKVVLLVNVASECGYTPQYKGLQELHEKYGKEGLVVIGVPSNDFGKQEPGSNAEILKFCQTNYKVTFPLLAKVSVKGDEKVPLFQHLTSKETNAKFSGEVGWNFEKFLIGRNGEVVGRFKSGVAPDSAELIAAIKKELDAK